MNPIVPETFSTCSGPSRSRRTSDALCAVVTPRSVSRRTASSVAWRTLSVVFSISAPDSRVWSPAVATSPACCLSWSDSRVTALTRVAACLAPWLARCAAAAASWLDAWICCVVAGAVQPHRLAGQSGVRVEAEAGAAAGGGVGDQLHFVGVRVISCEPHLLPRHQPAGELLNASEAFRERDVPGDDLRQPLDQGELVGPHPEPDHVNAGRRRRREGRPHHRRLE